MDATNFFLVQHASVHCGDVYGRPSYADRIWAGLSDAEMRARPGKGLNSLVWLLWHMARTEDAAVNLVVASGRQALDDNWARRMNVPWRTIGTGMSDDEVGELTARADVAAVRAYRSAVGLRTRDVVRALRPEAWDEIIGFADTARAAAAGAFATNTAWVDGMGYKPWQDQSRADRLGGAAIRHNALHLGEAVTLRGLAGFGSGV